MVEGPFACSLELSLALGCNKSMLLFAADGLVLERELVRHMLRLDKLVPLCAKCRLHLPI
jgi:hypothetical protein